MLKGTFCHIPGIGFNTERQLWSSGIQSWADFSASITDSRLPSGPKRKEMVRSYLQQSIIHLEDSDPYFFAGLLPTDQHWRLFPHFRGSVAYLDIETTGMVGFEDHITTIALYDGQTVFHYVHGANLGDFARDIDGYDLIITYNGKCFDVPFIGNTLGIRMDQVHIDLRYVLRSLGYGGGLKGCERQLGIGREDLDGVDGFFAVLLWHDYRKKGNTRALETLLAYNIMDVVNLEILMVMAYNMKLAGTPFAETLKLPLPAPPALPFQPDRKTIERIRESLWRNDHFRAFFPKSTVQQ